MRTLISGLAAFAFAALLLGAAILALAIELLPYVVIGCVVAAVITSRTRRHRVAAGAPAYRATPRPVPRYHAPQGEWVYVPVWVGASPRPAMSVIDAEVIEEPR